MKKIFQYLQALVSILFMISLVLKVYAWIPNGVFDENPGWWMSQIATMAITYGLVFCFVTFIKKYFDYKTEI